MAVSFIGSGFAEFLSLAFYYPLDLIKTRMQVANSEALHSINGNSHKYNLMVQLLHLALGSLFIMCVNGVLDATLKIINESSSKK